jgi:DNA-binding LacI/PurR family transcriptional regulator
MAVLMMDVAKRAGVSVTTVSHVMNETREIAPNTRARVLKAIQDLNYYKNNSARLLVRGHSDTVGMIVSDIENPFLPELIKSFEKAASSAGLELLLGMTNYEVSKSESAVRRMIESRVRGVAVMTSQLEGQLIDRLVQAELPIVLLDAPRAANLKSSLTIDYSAGIWAAVDHLAKSGHTEVAVIHGPLSVVSAARYLELLREAISEYNLRLLGVVEGDGRPEGGARGAQILLSMKRTPTAILCGNDLTAIGAMGMSTRMGFRVPDQLSIVGCDDIALAGYSQPTLSTVRIPRDVMGREAFRLLDKMSGSNSRRGRDAVVTTSFVARGSSGTPSRDQQHQKLPVIKLSSTKSPAASANSMKRIR